ncbi:MAG: hypothetical protein RRY35_07215, partial [Clostridiales bacterium]
MAGESPVAERNFETKSVPSIATPVKTEAKEEANQDVNKKASKEEGTMDAKAQISSAVSAKSASAEANPEITTKPVPVAAAEKSQTVASMSGAYSAKA